MTKAGHCWKYLSLQEAGGHQSALQIILFKFLELQLWFLNNLEQHTEFFIQQLLCTAYPAQFPQKAPTHLPSCSLFTNHHIHTHHVFQLSVKTEPFHATKLTKDTFRKAKTSAIQTGCQSKPVMLWSHGFSSCWRNEIQPQLKTQELWWTIVREYHIFLPLYINKLNELFTSLLSFLRGVESGQVFLISVPSILCSLHFEGFNDYLSFLSYTLILLLLFSINSNDLKKQVANNNLQLHHLI